MKREQLKVLLVYFIVGYTVAFTTSHFIFGKPIKEALLSNFFGMLLGGFLFIMISKMAVFQKR